MKQTPDNKNYSALEMGLTSISNLMVQISKNSDESLKLFKTMTEDTESFNGTMSSFFKGSALKRFAITTNLQLKKISNIDANLDKLYNFLVKSDKDDEAAAKKGVKATKLVKIEPPKKEKFERMSVKQSLTGITGGLINKSLQNLLAGNQKDDSSKGPASTNNILKQILFELKTLTKNNADNEETEGKKSTFDIVKLSSAIVLLNKNLSKKFFASMDTLAEKLRKLLEFDDKKVTKFDENMTKFTTSLSKLEKILKPVSLSLALFAGAFLLLSLTAISPLLAVALLMLSGFLWTLTKIFKTDPKLPNELDKFAIGIGILTLAMIAMNYVSWTSPFMMLGFIGGLGLVFKLYSSKVSLPKQLTDFAMGIGILTLAMFAMNYIDGKSIFKMLLFIGGLGLIFKLFTGKNSLAKQMKDFGLGIGILTLSLLAMNYVDWMSIGKLLAFIGVLALELALINKIGGSGPASGMIGFAFGIGILVLALFAMKELPWESLLKMVVFIAGLGLALKLYDAKSGMMMLGIGAGILLLSGALWVFTKTNFTPENMMVLGGTVLMLGIIFNIIGKFATQAILGAIAVGIIGVATALAYTTLALASKIDMNYGNLVIFGIVVGVLTALYSIGISTGILVLAVAGAVVTTVMVALTVVSALGLLLISQFNINISPFTTGITDLTWTLMKLAIPAVPALVAAALMIPLTGLVLVSALILKKVSEQKVDVKNIKSLTLGLQALVEGIDEIGLIAATKASAKALLLIPLLKALSILTSIKIMNPAEQALFKTSTSTAVDVLTNVMAKLDKWDFPNAMDSIPLISQFLSAFTLVDINTMSTITSAMASFMNNLSDNNKWSAINTNLNNLAKSFKNVVTNINMLNLEKALAFERTLKLMTDQQTNQTFEKVIEKLQEMINILYTKADGTLAKNSGTSETTPAVVTKETKETVKETSATDLMNKVQEMINQLNVQLSGVNEKLSGKLKMVLIDGNSNKIGSGI